MLWRPAESAEIVRLACPDAFNEAVPIVEPSANVTVPVAFDEPVEFTVAVSVIGWP